MAEGESRECPADISEVDSDQEQCSRLQSVLEAVGLGNWIRNKGGGHGPDDLARANEFFHVLFLAVPPPKPYHGALGRSL